MRCLSMCVLAYLVYFAYNQAYKVNIFVPLHVKPFSQN